MCNGRIESLESHSVALTGKVSIRGRHVYRKEIAKILQDRNIVYKDGANRATLLIFGDLDGQHVIDEFRKHSQKIELVSNKRMKGRHICVADSDGFSRLLDGGTATCQAWSL